MTTEDENQSAAEASDEDTRREALKKMGKYAAYTAPIMLAMMESAKAQVASGEKQCGFDTKCVL